jgi:hypothetical protein
LSHRHALVIGIDQYPGFGPADQLFGAVRDAEVMAEVLVERGRFEPEDVLRRFDAEATRNGLLDAFSQLRRRIRPGDQVLLFFSGHGSQMTDREGDEGDGLDETLVPYDSGRAFGKEGEAENRDISDDEINHWAAQILAVTPHLTLIFDCCHAATLHRPGWRTKSLPPDLRPIDRLPPSPVPAWRNVEGGPRPLMIAACRDSERAYELPPSATRKACGAFSLHLVEAMREAAASDTWREILSRVGPALQRDCPEQHPALSGEGLDRPLFSANTKLTRIGEGSLLEQARNRPDRFGLDVGLFRSGLGAWRRVEGVAQFREGDRLRIDLRHGEERELFVYLFDVGLSGRVSLLFPDFDGHESLDPGIVLRVGDRPGDRLRFHFPKDLAAQQLEGTGHLIVLAGPSRVVTSRILAAALLDDDLSALVLPYQLLRN